MTGSVIFIVQKLFVYQAYPHHKHHVVTFVAAISYDRRASSAVGRQHCVDRGVHYLRYNRLRLVLWRFGPASGWHVGVQAQQHVCSHSFVQLRWFLVELWYLRHSHQRWSYPRERCRGSADDVESLGHLDLLFLLVSFFSPGAWLHP